MTSVSPCAIPVDEMGEFLKAHPEVQFVDLLIADMNGVVRGKRIERASLVKVYEKGINLPASLFALDINGSTVESTGLGLDIGDSDRICYPIPGTLSFEPGQKRPTAQLAKRRDTYRPGDTDIAWTRITRWRGLLAATLDQPPHEKVTEVVVSGSADSPSTGLLAAWLARALRRPTRRVSRER